jgi:hypothetical protein
MSASAIYETPIEFKSQTLSGLRFTGPKQRSLKGEDDQSRSYFRL